MEPINRQPAEDLAISTSGATALTGRTSRELRPLTRMERFELAKQRVRALMIFSLGTASAACLLIYGAYLMTTRILL